MINRILMAFALVVSLAALLIALLTPALAQAQEINTDTGMDTPGAWMTETGWSVTGSKGVASSVISMKMLMQMSTAIKEGSRYRITFTVSSYTGSGEIRAFAGITMPSSAPAGSWVTSASVSDVADNFTTSLGLGSATPKGLTGPGDSAERGGAMRFGCNSGGFGLIDPLVYPGSQSPHLHEFYGNSGVRPDWTFNDFRTKGSSTCGEPHTDKGKKYPVNRSGYWIPAMLDGRGNAIRTKQITVYYKGPSDPALNYTGHLSVEGDPATNCAEISPTDDCRNIPTGLRMVTGWKSGGTCGPGDTDCTAANNTGTGTSAVTKLGGSNVLFDCWDTSGNPLTGSFTSLPALLADGTCNSKTTHQVRVGIGFPMCWNGTHVDSADHRSHMSYTDSGVCPPSHPVVIPTIAVMVFYDVDQAFLDGKWRLSSDEMVNGATAGSTLHGDYWEAWSPSIRDEWGIKCIWKHNSCGGSGELGGSTSMGVPLNYDGTSTGGNGAAKSRPDRYFPTSKRGMSKGYLANGTYTVELTAPGDGVWGFMGLNGFSGQIDNVSVTRLSIGKGPVTVTGTGG